MPDVNAHRLGSPSRFAGGDQSCLVREATGATVAVDTRYEASRRSARFLAIVGARWA
jgi:hypothetical protein